MASISEFIKQISYYATNHIAFIFIIDFAKQYPLLFTESELQDRGILYGLEAKNNYLKKPIPHIPIKLELIEPPNRQVFKSGFQKMKKHINQGDSYLLNLCYSSKIRLNCSLEQVFYQAKAPYKLYIPQKLVVFSPEPFVSTANNQIHTFPMKGTISAIVPNAEKVLINNPKEIQEHNTIVDLMRNDLGQIADNIKVKSYRYVQKINTSQGPILQTSSEIIGHLSSDWRAHLGEILFKLLPAGSISGAPKNKTLEIINQVELEKRGYYCGIFGYYDGQELSSAVAIRFIEQRENTLVFRSGVGITSQSNEQLEYQELLQKIYVPIT